MTDREILDLSWQRDKGQITTHQWFVALHQAGVGPLRLTYVYAKDLAWLAVKLSIFWVILVISLLAIRAAIIQHIQESENHGIESPAISK
jgi:hypothetical protein